MLNVSDIKEESITDYLVWKWRELDRRFSYLRITTFPRAEESSTTGADFELELWLVGRSFYFPLIVQAKKVVKQFDSYVNKLNYPNGTKTQLLTLMNYARTKRRLPFYFFYSMSDAKTETMCGAHDLSDTAVFMADAHSVKEFADGVHGKRISKNELLGASNPFHCMFCCPLTQSGDYFKQYFSRSGAGTTPSDNDAIPDYVTLLLSGRLSELGTQQVSALIERNELRMFRTVGVYDMRDRA